MAALGDVDGDNQPELAVGSYPDDDGGTDRGAVYILFLNADGTVRAQPTRPMVGAPAPKWEAETGAVRRRAKPCPTRLR